VYLALALALALAICGIGTFVGYLAQRLYVATWPWVSAHIDAIVAVVLTVCVIALAVLAVAEKARKDNPSW
jgi:F0F1-type ATP synthase membrane subunit a